MLKRSKIITDLPKTTEKTNIIDLKSVTIEHPKTSRKIFKTIRHTKKVSQVSGAGRDSISPLYKETTETENAFDKKRL